MASTMLASFAPEQLRRIVHDLRNSDNPKLSNLIQVFLNPDRKPHRGSRPTYPKNWVGKNFRFSKPTEASLMPAWQGKASDVLRADLLTNASSEAKEREGSSLGLLMSFGDRY
jgi:hypothetical protein